MNIPYRIKQIVTKQFAYFPEKFVNGKGIELNVGFDFKVHADLKNIMCISKFSYSQEENLLMTTEIECIFDISSEGFQQLQKEKKVSASFLQYLATIATGTARGIIHSRTEGTVINSIVLPPINLTTIIKEDLTFN